MVKVATKGFRWVKRKRSSLGYRVALMSRQVAKLPLNKPGILRIWNQ